MKKLLLVIGIMTALFATSCKKDTSVSGGDTPQGDKSECFYFEAVDAGAVVGMENETPSYSETEVLKVSLEYSTDKTNWSPFVVDETSVTLANVGDRVYIRAKGTNDKFYILEGKEDHSRNSFTATGKVKVGGNIMFLLDGTGNKDNFDTLLNKYAFGTLFWYMKSLTDASSLVLPATTLAEDCYSAMFVGCTSLANAPSLPATILAERCYESMFNECSSLTSAPKLPATTLAEGCYGAMFAGCASLTNAPALPATTLTNNCYSGMFEGCTSLANAPELPATTLAQECYRAMFEGCTSLTVAPTLPATTLANGCYDDMFADCTSLQSVEVNFVEWWSPAEDYGWLKNVSATGTFTCPAALDVSTRDEKHVPQGWTIVTK